MKRIGLIALTLFAVLSVAACETVQGVGQDLENAGEAISEEAEQAQG